MSEKKFYIEKKEISKDKAVVYSEYNHIVNVMRAKAKDKVILICDDGYFYHAVIEKIRKDNVEFLIEKKEKDKNLSKVEVTAFLGLLKADNMDFAVQKLSELSVSNVMPFVSKNTVVAKDTNKIPRLQKIAEQSARQCGRSKILKISNPLDFNEVLESLSEFDVVFFAYELEQKLTLKKALASFSGKSIAFVVGSEGGFTEEEAKLLSKKKNVKAISLGNLTLRAETASIVLAANLLYELN